MCRLAAYVGPPTTLSSIVLDPPHSLLYQSYAPKYQTRGKVNADGFGVGWYDHSVRPEPARYRSVTPIWGDASFASFAPVVRSTTMVASVRSATPPNPIEPSGVAPFMSGHWLFTHNGLIEGFRHGPDGRDGVRADLTALVSRSRLAGIDGATDSELLFALLLDQIDAGMAPDEALRVVVSRTLGIAPACLNMILSDGENLWATVSGESLFCRSTGDAVTIASEPLDEQDIWEKVPEGSLLQAAGGGFEVSSL
ncbi:MAG TPA: ergothioneine biosynthesis protein EgtC [Acidimicrobiales bacterium]|nr:ergothioneine biosynthesis protein EgtC [Acidimicrobiales bacterium]